MTKICVFGAGAIGGYLAGALYPTPAPKVSLIARGPHLAAIREKGLGLDIDGAVRRYDRRRPTGRPNSAPRIT